jgi:rhomboid protease GluP
VPLSLHWQRRLERWRNSLTGLFRSSSASGRPRLCPACGTLVGSSATKCHECGASLSFSLAAASRSLSSLLPTESPVTYIVLGLNFLLFGVSLLITLRITQTFNLLGSISGFVLDRLGACRPLPLLGGQWWRLVMPIFLHGGVLHIAMNTWVLMDLGPQVEEVYGSARYLFLYLATGAAGFLTSSVTGHFSVGASGALMGLIGVMLAITTRRGGAYMQMVRGQLLRWVVYILVFGILVRGVDNAAHLGGLAAGFLLGRVMADREPVTAAERQRAYALGWLAGLVVVASFAAMFVHYFRAAE